MKITLPIRVCKLAILLFGITTATQAQQLKLGANPTAVKKSALLELESTNQGLLLTRISDTSTLTSPIKAALDGTIIYLTTDNSLRIRSLGAWQKIATGTGGTGTITLSGDLTGTGTGTVPATINNQAVTFAKFQNVNAQRLLGRFGGTAGSVQEISLDNSLGLTGAGLLYADSSKPIWNASRILGRPISTTAPTDGYVLKWNTASSAWIPSDDITGGASYGTLTSNDIRNADAPDPKYRMKIWASPNTGVVSNGPLGTTANAWSVLSFQNGTYTTQLYFDKNSMALREWMGNTAPLQANPGPPVANPWYKVVTTLGDNSFTEGGLIFANQTTDANTEVTQDANNLFWDDGNNRLGIGTNSPQRRLHVNAGNAAVRLQNLSTTSNTTNNALIIDVNGDVTQTNTLNAISIGATDRSSGAFTTIAGATATINFGGTNTNNNVNIGQATLIRVSANNNFSITGITAGVDGQIIVLYNTSNRNMTITNESGNSTNVNRITTTTGANIVTNGEGTVTLIYSATDDRWIVTASTL